MLNKDILDSLGEGVITVDKDFRVTFFNRAAEIITGYKLDEVAGSYEITFNAQDLSSGVYFYQIIANNFVSTKKLVLLK
jgi:PAS domain S-box-containing protein